MPSLCLGEKLSANSSEMIWWLIYGGQAHFGRRCESGKTGLSGLKVWKDFVQHSRISWLGKGQLLFKLSCPLCPYGVCPVIWRKKNRHTLCTNK